MAESGVPALIHPNYNHLLYFWAVVREGGVAGAARSLHVTPQTISGQVKLLEQRMAGRLLERKGRQVVPTVLGLAVFRYAEEIFAAGQDLMRAVEGVVSGNQRSVAIGVSDVVPNLVAWRAIAPLMKGPENFRVTCHTGSLDTLVAELAARRLDLVLSTSSLPATAGFRAFSHHLGECDIAFFAARQLAARLSRGFPRSLHQAPFILPTERSPNRRVIDDWFQEQDIVPRIVGEFDDTALVKTFAQDGTGVFVAPSAIADEIAHQYRLRVVGTTGAMRAKFYALTTERRVRHPAVARFVEVARGGLFGVPQAATVPP